MSKKSTSLEPMENLYDLINKRNRLLGKLKGYQVWRPPCRVKILIVADGNLDFGLGDFGLSTFVHLLQNTKRFYIEFDITLAHLFYSISDELVSAEVSTQSNFDLAELENLLIDRSAITRHIKDFCFDNTDHFTFDMYDEVWLFGIETNYHQNGYKTRIGNPNKYPKTRLGDQELKNLSKHMDRGGGIFATGDHGSLGTGLCGHIKRVRNMRYWDNFPNENESQVGMRNELRNDTNQPGRDVSMAGDQSDDIPQPLELKLYSSWLSNTLLNRFPHPVFCCRYGKIDVFPDHPHEGECRTPSNPNENYPYDNTIEYPHAPGGTEQVLPEIIAWSKVIGGTTSGSKDPAISQKFGAVCAYDGHWENVGRIICDSTWHHFVNVNLIGILEGGIFSNDFNIPGVDQAKHLGFLATPSGRQVLAKIAEYYINIGVWIASPGWNKCFLRGGMINITYKEHVVESSVINANISIDKIDLKELRYIGTHARDVLGNSATQCESLHWIITWLIGVWPGLSDYIDPWLPNYRKIKDKTLLPVFDIMPIVDIAFGSALLGMRQAIPYPDGKFNTKHEKILEEAAIKYARVGLSRALNCLDENLKTILKITQTYHR